jgi:hypothetical protein
VLLGDDVAAAMLLWERVLAYGVLAGSSLDMIITSIDLGLVRPGTSAIALNTP